jgi:hypothetical protein
MRAESNFRFRCYRTPGFWATPRNLAIVVSVVCAVAGAASGWLGYSIAPSMPASQIIILQLPPGTTATVAR